MLVFRGMRRTLQPAGLVLVLVGALFALASCATSSKVPTDSVLVSDAVDDVLDDDGRDTQESGALPSPETFMATQHFELLPASDAFSEFRVEDSRVQILPLATENFPPGIDYCSVGSDAELNEMQQYARAQLGGTIRWTGLFAITLETVAEVDGESRYQLMVNSEVVAEADNPPTASTAGVEDLGSFDILFDRIPLRQGDSVTVLSRPHSNLSLSEGAACRTWSDTYAWARGRWTHLTLEPIEP